MNKYLIKKQYLLFGIAVLFISVFLYLFLNQTSQIELEKKEITHKEKLVESFKNEKNNTVNLPSTSVTPKVIASSKAVSDHVVTNEIDKVNKQLTNEALVVKESQPKTNEFLNIDDINIFLLEPTDRVNAAFLPLVERLKEDPVLRQEWLEWLSTAENKNVKYGAEIVLSNLPIDDLVGFASNSLKHGQKRVIEYTVSALSRRSDLDLVSSHLKDDVVNLLIDERVHRYAKIDALKVLSERPELYADHERIRVSQAVEKQLLSEDLGLRAKAVNAIIKLDVKNNSIEPAVLSGITNQDIETRKKSLDRMDYQLELGLELSNEAVASIHHQVLSDVSSDIEFAEGEKERYVETAAYILGNLNLTESQIYEMQEAGLPYIDHRIEEELDDNVSESDNVTESDSEEKT